MWHQRWRLLVLLLSISLLLVLGWMPNRSPIPPVAVPVEAPVLVPAFSRLDCFHRNGIREPWESPLPDGIIEWVGYHHYLVMFRGEADRRSAGPKEAMPLDIARFDEQHHVIACPPAWLKHGRAK